MTNKKSINVIEKLVNQKPGWNKTSYLPLPDSSGILAVCKPVKKLYVSSK